MDQDFWDARYAAKESVWGEGANEFVIEYLSALPEGKMIDVAGGEGRNASWFIERGWQAEVVDFSTVALEKFLSHWSTLPLTGQALITQADVTQDYQAKLAPVDLVLMAYLQIERPLLERAIRVAVAQARPGATFFGVFHALENLTDGVGGPQIAELLPSTTVLRHIATSVGLEIDVLSNRDRCVSIGGTQHVAVDVVLRATVL